MKQFYTTKVHRITTYIELVGKGAMKNMKLGNQLVISMTALLFANTGLVVTNENHPKGITLYLRHRLHLSVKVFIAKKGVFKKSIF